MSNVSTQENQFEIYKMLSPLLGAVLSIIGGFFAVIIRERVSKKSEIEYIKIGFNDELHEISAIVTRLNDTYKTTHIVPNSYLNDLSKNTDSFKSHKQKLYLIKDAKLRRDIVGFYKKLDEDINDSINKVGKLGEQQVGVEHDAIVSKFTTIKNTAESLNTSLSKYKYKSFWVF